MHFPAPKCIFQASCANRVCTMAHAWCTHGPRMAHVWATCGAHVGHTWRTRGPCVGHAWCTNENSSPTCGPHVVHAWPTRGACVAHAWHMPTACPRSGVLVRVKEGGIDLKLQINKPSLWMKNLIWKPRSPYLLKKQFKKKDGKEFDKHLLISNIGKNNRSNMVRKCLRNKEYLKKFYKFIKLKKHLSCRALRSCAGSEDGPITPSRQSC